MKINKNDPDEVTAVLILGAIIIIGKLSITGFVLWLAYRLVMYVTGG